MVRLDFAGGLGVEAAIVPKRQEPLPRPPVPPIVLLGSYHWLSWAEGGKILHAHRQ